MTFFEKLTDRQSMVFYVLFCETNKQTNKFVNEENNLYQDLVGSHKATMLQFLHVYTYENTVRCKSDYLLLKMFIGNRLASHTSTYHVLPLYETEVVLTKYKD
jgi:hypothetical protein